MAVSEVSSSSTPLAEKAEDFQPKGGMFGFFLMIIGMFMAILDIQIVASSLPQIQAGISASADQITWVQTAYLVAEVVMIPLSGWLARVMSSQWLFAMSSASFTIMSIACAMAWDTPSMLIFRALQGFLGGAMIPTAFASVFKILPPERQVAGTVVAGLTATVAPAIGPTLGGYLTETVSWHWLFLVNIVPGAIVSILVPLFVRVDRPNWHLFRTIDFFSIALVAGFLGSLEFVLDEGARHDWFESGMIVFFALLSVTSGILLVWRSLSLEHPTIDLRVFANRNFTIGCILAFVMGMCLIGQTYIVPQFLSHIRGYNAMQIGHVMAVTGISMFLSAPLAGKLGTILDVRIILFSGFALVCLGLYFNSHMTTEVGYDQLLVPQIVRGVGLILNLVTITTVSLGTLPTDMVSAGSAQFNVFRNMGGAVGLALINTQWDGRYDRHYWWIMESLSNTNQRVTDQVTMLSSYLGQLSGINSDSDTAAIYTITRQIQQQASIMAWNDVFLMLAIAFLFAAPLTLFLAKPKKEAAGNE
nr:DHA2 family efflux MFS transporter permease subunit [uncultured Cohaesibacter sp.]